MKNILTEALVNSATNASFIFSYTNSAKLRYYLDRLDVDVSKKEELREMNVMELRQEIALKIKIFVANSN